MHHDISCQARPEILNPRHVCSLQRPYPYLVLKFGPTNECDGIQKHMEFNDLVLATYAQMIRRMPPTP